MNIRRQIYHGQAYYYLSKVESMRGRKSSYGEINKFVEIVNTTGAKHWIVKAEQAVREYMQR